MNPVKIISVLAPAALFLLVGCAGSVQNEAKAPVEVNVEDEPMIVVPYDVGPSREMEMSWEPKEAPPERPEPKARKMDAKPSFVTGKSNKRRLFVMPAKFEH